MYKQEFENESVEQSSIFKPATDTFMAAVPWTKNRMIVVFRRERNGRQYVRCRTFNRRQIKKIWYPSPRFYMVPVDCAVELGKAIIAAARGEQYGQVPGWCVEFLDTCYRSIQAKRPLLPLVVPSWLLHRTHPVPEACGTTIPAPLPQSVRASRAPFCSVLRNRALENALLT